MKQLVVCIGVCFVFSGCGGGSNDGGASAVDQLLLSAAQAECDWEFRCCKDSELKIRNKTRYTDVAGCVPFRLLDLKATLFFEHQAVSAGRMRVDPVNSAACVAAMKMQACNQMNGQPPMMNMKGIDPCSKAFVGAVMAGGQCVHPADCADGTRCIGASTDGVCEPAQKRGEICNGNSDCDQSAASLYCSQSDFHCRVRAAVGQPCAFTDNGTGKPSLPLLVECDQTAAAAYCDPVSGLCKHYPQDGEPCLSQSVPGIISLCEPDPSARIMCDSFTDGGTCRAVGKIGSDCTRIPCDQSQMLYCDRGSNRCAALPSVGQSCRNTGACQPPAYCDSNGFTCATPAQLGEDCLRAPCDVTLFCDHGSQTTCRPRIADGAPCTGSQQCQSDLCLFNNAMTGICQPTHSVICSGRM